MINGLRFCMLRGGRLALVFQASPDRHISFSRASAIPYTYFDELTNEQAVMHYSRHRLRSSVAYVTTKTYASTNDQ